MGIKITIPNTSSDTLTFGSANTTTAAQIAGIDSGSTNGQLAFYTTATGTSTERMRIDASGNVGIGTTSPDAKLEVTVGDNGGINIEQSGSSQTGYLTFRDSDGGIDGRVSYDHSNNSMRFTTATTERMRIDSSGNLLVGGTSLNEVFSGIPTIQGSTNCIFTNKRSTTGSASQFRFYNPNGQVGDISTSGSATTYGTSSDYRLKENVAPMTGALATVAQLKPCTYTWKIDGSSGQGFIAHELQAVVPDCVTGEKDAVNEDGSIKPQGIDTSFLVATLTAAIQEQQALITQLQADVAALKGTA